jgi:N utilization substance protein B
MNRPTRKGASSADGLFPRSAARAAAVQALYQMDLAATDVSQVVAQFTSDRLPNAEPDYIVYGADPQFFADIVRGVVRRQRDIDPEIDRTLATGWRLFRVDSTLRAILRAALFELLERPDVPARVVINEYINVAKAFFSDEEPRVVNGVLDKLARANRAAEFPAAKEPERDDG